ncbi:ABC transporter substrate-binding protein [Acetobacter vaccinii]|uniref:SsuA/THI5-like domain-containing protein n=1 Tax=Acetobacter vaccinii TaxID=2592655 RepID=A0A5C1YPB6_9PROT|nr:ABC transporter substrate-binding protein [Acetobacter vaccinii]QEO18164.1 hypothetical protein FLP30_10855 [Acetobacter vaccinii]
MNRRHLIPRRVAVFGLVAQAAAFRATTGVAATPEGLAVWHYKGQVSDFFNAAEMKSPSYPVSYVNVEGGKMVLNAYRAKALDYAFMSQIPALFAGQNASPFRLIAAIQGGVSYAGLLVPEKSTAASVKDLRNKKIGYVPATNHHYYLLKILTDNGMTPDDIQPVPLSAAAGRAAFVGGYLDALISDDYVAELLMEESAARWLTSDISSGGLSFFAISARVGAMDDRIKSGLIEDYLVRERATWDWVAANPEAWSRIMAAETAVPERIFRRLSAGRQHAVKLVPVTQDMIREQQKAADLFFSEGSLPNRIDAESLWDLRFSRLLQ